MEMNTHQSEKRQHQRQPVEKAFRVYTSITNAAYTLEVGDISPRGAFLKTNHPPALNEKISFEALDKYLRRLYMGHGTVKWISDNQNKMGFGIEFDEEIPNKVMDH